MSKLDRMIVIGTAVVISASAMAQGPPAASVLVQPTEVEVLQAQRRVTGELHAVSRSRVATAEGGRVVECPAEEGRRVRVGDVLAVLDARRLDASRIRLEAEWAVAAAVIAARTAERDRADRDLETLRGLAGRDAANANELADSEQDRDIAQAQLDEAEHRLAIVEADRDLLAVRLADTRVVAPFDGVIVAVSTEVGEWVSEGDPIAEVVATGRSEAWLDVPERLRVAMAHSDATATLEIKATGLHATGLPIRIVPLVDPIARTFRVIVAVDDSDGLLAAGMSVDAWLPTSERAEFLTVPRDAILRNEIGSYVYMVVHGQRGAAAVPAVVEVLFDAGDRIAVSSARLHAGAAVVVEGGESLFPGSPVMPRPKGSAAPAPPGVAGGTD